MSNSTYIEGENNQRPDAVEDAVEPKYKKGDHVWAKQSKKLAGRTGYVMASDTLTMEYQVRFGTEILVLPENELELVDPATEETRQPVFEREDFKYNVGDIVKVSDPDVYLCSPILPNKQYHDNLRVVFRFYDGSHVYVVETEDGICLITPEHQVELVERSRVSNTSSGSAPAIPTALYKRLKYLGITPDEVRAHNVGASDYSKHTIQPWSIWLDYNLNPWDADIVKRVLRVKDTDPRIVDYEKIIHICEERIRQLEIEEE